MSWPSSPGRVVSSSSTTGATEKDVKPCGATSTGSRASAYQSSGTSYLTNGRERGHPIRVRGSAGVGDTRLESAKLTMAGRYVEKVWE